MKHLNVSKPKKCMLCGSTKDVAPYVGGPVQLMCKKCDRIIKLFFAYKEAHDRAMKEIDERIKDLPPTKITLA